MYLAGNGFRGDLGAVQKLGSKLSELKINANRIAGSLPSSILSNHNFSVFNISENKITGYLDQAISPLTSDKPSEYQTHVNRLSGALPVASIDQFSTVNILNGNMFSCGTIPSEDVDVSAYSCGSQNFEVSVYFWLACFAVSLAASCLVTYYSGASSVLTELTKLNSFADRHVFTKQFEKNIPKTVQFVEIISRVSDFTAKFSAFLVLSTIVIYSGLKMSPGSELYRTHSEQYWHTISGLYLKSATSASCLLVLYILSLGILLHSYAKLFLIYRSPGKEGKGKKENTEGKGIKQLAREYLF